MPNGLTTITSCNVSHNRLRVFTSANTAHLGHRGGQERQPRVIPSEKYAARRGSAKEGMRMSTACFARAPQRYLSRPYMLTGCKFQVPQNLRRLINVYASNFMP